MGGYLRTFSDGSARLYFCLALLACFTLLFSVTPIYAAVDDAEYNEEDLNQGNNIITPGSHSLPANGVMLFWDELPIGSELTAVWTWHTQGNILLNTQNLVPVLTNTAVNNDPLTNNLYEGRTQILTFVTGDITGSQYLAATGFNDGSGTAADLYFDTDQGPPDHPDLVDGSISGITAPNGFIINDPVYGQNRAQIEFNQAATTPFTIDLEGILRNIPTNIVDPISPEVFGTVRADIVRIPGGSISPQPSPVTTNTRPYEIPWPPEDLVTPPVYDMATPGSWEMTFDFSTVQDGRYEIRLTATDVVGNSSPGIAETTSTVLTVILDRGNPAIAYTQPGDPFIIGRTPPLASVYEDGLFTVVGYVDDLYSLPADVDTTVRESDNSWNEVFPSINTLPAPSGVFSQEMNFTVTGPGNIGANQPVPGEQVYWIAFSTAIDSSGNATATSAALNVIYDLAPPNPPQFSAPSMPYATTADQLTFSVFLDNLLAAPDEDLEEHGTVLFELTVYPSLSPTQRTTFTFGGSPSGTVHSSLLDDAAVNTGPDPLGNIADSFSGSQLLNLAAWSDGELTVEIVAIDQVGNRSTPEISTFTKGMAGPELVIDPLLSGPDDNYDIAGQPPMGQPPNIYGSDDLIFVMSLKSPEKADNGITGLATGFFPPPNDFDPYPTAAIDGNEYLLLSGTFSDVVTEVVQITAWGANMPTTSVTISPPVTSGAFSITVDARALPEGTPQVVNIRGTNLLGVEGPVTSVIAMRDVIPGRRPTITSPVTQPVFTTANSMNIQGYAEPNSMVALVSPVTSSTIPGFPPIAVPLLRTRNGLGSIGPFIPRTDSDYNSLPGAPEVILTRADSLGFFSFTSVDLSMVSSSATLATTFLIQSVDTFDNTDPVESVSPVEIFRNDGSGNIIRVTIDPGLIHEFEAYSAPPVIPPTSGQFRGIEGIIIRAEFDSPIVIAPVLLVTQRDRAAVTAGITGSLPSMTQPTTVIDYLFNVSGVHARYDGGVLTSFSGGRDVFGNVIAPLDIPDSFHVDTVAPVRTNNSSVDFYPVDGVSTFFVTTVAVDLTDIAANPSIDASGLSTTWSVLELTGPLEEVNDYSHPLITAIPLFPYDLAANPASVLTTEGTYRISVTAMDNVGNQSVFFSTFLLDSSPIDPALIVLNPLDGSSVNQMPQTTGQDSVVATIFDLAFDPFLSSISLHSVFGTTIPLNTYSAGPGTLAGILSTPFATDGSDDGMYITSAVIFDRAGNPTAPVSGTFIFDTTPPSIYEFDPDTALFPKDEDCCKKDPLRKVQVFIGDPPSVNTTNPYTSGVDLSTSRIKLLLNEPFYPNETDGGTLVPTQKKIQIVSGQSYDIIALEILDDASLVRSLNADGSEDGIYDIVVNSADLAGNTTEVISKFYYDTQHPRVSLHNFPEESFFAGSIFTITGVAFDLGPCGFDHRSTGTTDFPTSAVQIKLEKLDENSNPISPITSPFFDFLDSNYVSPAAKGINDVATHRAEWGFVHTIPDSAGPAKLTIKAIDCAKNETIITRMVTIKEGTMSSPKLLFPENASVISEKTVMFSWDPVITAYRYDFELTRVSPAAVTTSTTYAIPFPTARYHVDLPLFSSIHPGGTPIVAGSIFGWRVRSYDVSDNAGDYSVPSYFTVDPNKPSVLNVLLNGMSAGPTTIVSNGSVNVMIDFSDETGMDTGRSPLVSFSPLNSDIGPQSIGQTDFTSTTWSGLFKLPLTGPSGEDANGPAAMTIGGFYDLAGNALTETTATFYINTGAWFDVKLFPNPVNPVELLFNVFSMSYENGPFVTVPYSDVIPNPRVTVRQQGQSNWSDVSVYAMPGTTPVSAAFRGAYTVNKSLLGEVDFLVSGIDETGVSSVRGFSINVVEALSREGVLFFGSTPGSHIAIPPVALSKNALLYSVKEENGPPVGQGSPELLKLRSIGWFMPANIILEKQASIYASLEDSASLPCKNSQIGLYRYNGNSWEYCDTEVTGRGFTGKSLKLGAFALMADIVPPKLSLDESYKSGEELSRRPELVVRYNETGSGLDLGKVQFYIDGNLTSGDLKEEDGAIKFTPAGSLSSGHHEVEVVASDLAGNESGRLNVSIVSAAAIMIEKAVAYPSPARSFTKIRYNLSQPGESAKVRIYDTAGKRLYSATIESPFSGVNEFYWDLRSSKGRTVANGVYLYRIEARGVDGTKSVVTGKVAVLR